MTENDASSTPNGLIQCLRMLAEEASILHLDRTFTALMDALDTCHLEVSANLAEGYVGPARPGVAIH